MARPSQIDRNGSRGVAAVVVLVLWVLAVGIITLVALDAYEKYALSKPPSPTVWIDNRDDGRV